jgi:hypothetical protein
LTGRRIALRLGVRSTLPLVALLILGGAGVFWWQRSQIVHLRGQVARQGDALDDISLRLGGQARWAAATPGASRALGTLPNRHPDEPSAEARDDERRVIVDQYRDVLAQMDLPPETAARLLELLTERIETVLDAQDAAVREGFAEGSAQTARAVGMAVSEVDRDIVGLVGPEGMRRIDGLPAAPQAEPAPPAQPATPVVVTMIVQSPAPDYAAVAQAQTVASDNDAQYASYPLAYFPLYSFATALREPRGRRNVRVFREGNERSSRNPSIFAAR